MAYPTVEQIGAWIFNEGQKKDVKDLLVASHLMQLLSNEYFLGLVPHIEACMFLMKAIGKTPLDFGVEQTAFGILLGLQIAKTFQEEELAKCQAI